MIREWLSHLHWSTLPIITMFMFIGVFLGSVAWAFRKRSAEIYREASQLPLHETEVRK